MVKSLSTETLKGAVYLGGWGTISKVFGALNSFIIVYLLSVYDYGLYSLVLSIVSLTEIVLFENMDQLIINDILIEKTRNNLDKAKKIYQEYFLYKGVIGLLGFIALFFFSEIIARYAGYVSIGLFIKIAAFLVIHRALLSFVRVNLRLSKKFSQLGSMTFMQEFFKIIILCSMLIFIKPGIAKVIFAMVLANIAGVSVIVYKNKRSFKYWLSQFKVNLGKMELWRILKAHGKWNALENIIANLQKNISLWMVKLFISTEAVGIYNFGKNLYKQLDDFLPVRKVISQFLPEIHSDKPRMQRAYIYGTKYYSLLNIAIGLSGIIGVLLIIYLFLPKYILALPVFLLFMLIPVSYGGMFVISNTILFTLRQQKFLAYLLGFRTFLLVILNSIFIPVFGVFGAAFERVVTMFISTLISHLKVSKLLDLKANSFLKIFSFQKYDEILIRSFLTRVKSGIVKIFSYKK